MTAYEASTGVADGRYYFSVTLPGDFSQSVASPTGPDPQKARIIFTYNDANNYLGTIIGQNAAQQILNAVSAQIGEQSVDQVLVGLGEAGDGLRRAADGAGQLSTGAQAADAGAQQLAGGSRTLADGLGTAKAGSAALADGTAQLSAGIDTASGGRARWPADSTSCPAPPPSSATARVRSAPGEPARRPGHRHPRRRPRPGHRAQLAQLRDGAQQLAFQLGDPSSPYRAGMTQAVGGAGQLRDGLTQYRQADSRRPPARAPSTTVSASCRAAARRWRRAPANSPTAPHSSRTARRTRITAEGRQRAGPAMGSAAAHGRRTDAVGARRARPGPREPRQDVRHRLRPVLPAAGPCRRRHHHVDAVTSHPEQADLDRAGCDAGGARVVWPPRSSRSRRCW